MNYDLCSLKEQAVLPARSPGGWPQGKKPVVLYGAGGFGRCVLAALRARGLPVAAFLDGSCLEPSTCDGLPLYPLHHPQAAAFGREGHLALLTVFNHRNDWQGIVSDLNQCGFESILTPMEIFDGLPELAAARYWIAPRAFYLEKWHSFLEGEKVWEDETSREIYRRLLAFRLGRDLSAHPEPEIDRPYAPRDLPRWREPVRLLDGGACVGEAVRTLGEAGYRLEQLYAWEPDLANFQELEKWLAENQHDLPCVLFPCGLGIKTEEVSFASGLGTASAVLAGGEQKTVVLRADSALRGQAVTLIKLDIEGAEMDALAGLREIIGRQRPGLAVCIYHRPDDLYRIPALIQSWNLSYRLHLRAHAYNTFDTVLYALPAD